MPGAEAVVIGGGAAGIAAARALHDAGRDVLLLEAKHRLGGRAHSERLRLPAKPVTPVKAGISHREGTSPEEMPASAGMTRQTDVVNGSGVITVDHGCGWLHSARRNPWVAIAEAAGLTVDRTPPGWRDQWRGLGFPAADQQAFGEAWNAMERAADAMRAGPDRPLADAVAPGEWRPLIEAISGYANGAQLADVSLHDWLAYEDAATDDNWSVREGYGTLVAGHAAGVPVRTGCAVRRIDYSGRIVRVGIDRGTIETQAVVVALPTTVLARGDVAFDPPLPDKQAAADALPLGLADKMFLAVDGPAFPENAHLIGNPRSAMTASYRLSPFGEPWVEAFLGGACAAAMECEDDRAAYAFALAELTDLLGGDWRFTPLARTRWGRDPHIGGSYSHARVGRAGERAALAASVDGRIFFAGEACSAHDFSTAHGAYETGRVAAAAVIDHHIGGSSAQRRAR